MKRLYSFKAICLTLVVMFFISCNKTDKPAEGFVDFGYAESVLKSLTSDSVIAKPAPVPMPPVPINDIYAALVTISDASGNVVISKQEIPLYNLSGSYISKQLSLKTGKYKLTDFLIINSARVVVYATPKAGSTKASMVKLPLPIDFEISANNTSHLIPEVLAINGTITAGDLGYLTFGFVIVNPSTESICLNIAILNGMVKCLCDVEIPGHIQIYANGSNLVFDQTLDTTVHTIKFPKSDQYTFVVTSGTLPPFKQMYTIKDLQPYFCQMSQRLRIKVGNTIIDTTKIPPVPAPYIVPFGSDFKLMQGMSAQMEKDVLRVEFISFKDSRCPLNATCVWAGEFSVTLQLYLSGVTTTVEVKGKSTAVYGPYTIELVDLLPYPAEVSIPEKTAILKVTK